MTFLMIMMDTRKEFEDVGTARAEGMYCAEEIHTGQALDNTVLHPCNGWRSVLPHTMRLFKFKNRYLYSQHYDGHVVPLVSA